MPAIDRNRARVDAGVETLAGDEPARGAVAVGRGATIGRYVVLDVLGRGGMGVVFAAYDPELDRKIALKLVRPPASASGNATDDHEGRARLGREAQAMARLSHPNVVAVHDVGVFADQVYVAMELVQGVTLGRWLGARPRGQREIVEMLIQAGRGLAAAHAAGVIHRDFKPDNVLVGDDGRARVLDFGLARAEHSGGPAHHDGAVEMAATAAGCVMGTPAYMAPEQHLGLPTDARTDQFAFCVALHEALCGQRPFRGDSLAALALAVTDGRPDEPPGSARAPSWLRRLILRGLAVDPQARHASMAALLAELGDDPRARHRRWLAVAGAVAVVGVSIGAYQWSARIRAAGCDQEAAAIDTVWNPTSRDAARSALVATGLAHAEQTWSHVDTRIGVWAETWRQARRESCAAQDVPEEPARVHQRVCLDDRLVDARALVATLADADRDVVNHAAEAAASLDPVDRCTRVLAGEVANPSGSAASAERAALGGSLAVARAEQRAGRAAAAGVIATEVLKGASAIADAPMVAEVSLLLGNVALDLADYPTARTRFEDAYYAAGGSGHDDVATQAAVAAIKLNGEFLYERATADSWVRAAQMELARGGADDPLVVATVEVGRATLANAWGRHGEAIELLERGLATRERLLGADHPTVALTLAELATALGASGQTDRAQVAIERATAAAEAAFGSSHPRYATLLFRSGAVLAKRGQVAEALAREQRALEIVTEALGEEHPQTAKMSGATGQLLLALGRTDDAIERMQKTTQILERAHGPDHPDVAIGISTLGVAHATAGHAEQALASFERAAAIFERVLGPQHSSHITAQIQVGKATAALGRHREALDRFESARANAVASLGPEHPSLVYVHSAIGRAWLDLSAAATALPPLRLAVATCTSQTVDPSPCAEAHHLLALAAWRTGDRETALQQAAAARAIYDGQSRWTDELAELDRWIADPR